MEEIDLLRAATQNDLESFNQLILKYQNMVYNQAYRILQNPDIAEDITQDTFIIGFQKLIQFRGGSFRAWLLKIVTNLCYDEMREWKRATLLSLEPVNDDGESIEEPIWLRDPGMLPEETVERHELQSVLEQGLNKLPHFYREAVQLVDIQQLSYKEASFVSGISIGTLKSRLARGRWQLRNNLASLDTSYLSGLNIFDPAQNANEYLAN